MSGERKPIAVHCWQDGPETADGCSTTCLLWEGHEGPHKWSRDDAITITFRDEDSAAEQGEANGR